MKKKYYLFKMNTRKLNIISSIIGILLFIIFMVVYLQKLTIGELADEIYNAMPLIVILMFPYFILHEIFHSIAYVLHGAKFKNITYGAYLEKGILCCLCKQNISKKNILISLLYPFFFLGIVTIIIGYIITYTTILLSLPFSPLPRKVNAMQYCNITDSVSPNIHVQKSAPRRPNRARLRLGLGEITARAPRHYGSSQKQ